MKITNTTRRLIAVLGTVALSANWLTAGSGTASAASELAGSGRTNAEGSFAVVPGAAQQPGVPTTSIEFRGPSGELTRLKVATPSVTRAQILQRAQHWADVPVPYSQSTNPAHFFEGYRRDCSGYVSATWGLGASFTTTSLPQVAHPITKDQLLPGDVLLAQGNHVVIFEKWTSSSRTSYVGYEQTPPHTMHRTIPYPYFNRQSEYSPWRYDNVIDSADGIGVFRPGTQSNWYLDFDADGSTNQNINNWGHYNDQPVAGDWDGDGGDGIGVYRTSTGRWYLDYNNDGSTDSTVDYGEYAGDRAVVGDWDGDGSADIGIYRDGVFHLDIDRNGSTNIHVSYGAAGDRPFAGDWDGDGDDSVGVYRPSNGTVYLDYNNDGHSDDTVVYGAPNDRPVAGDWDGNGTDGIGMWRPTTQAVFYLDNNRDGRTDRSIPYGAAADRAVVGDWRNP